MWLGLGAGVGKGKNELVSDTISLQRQAISNSFLPQAVWVGLGRGGQRQKRISVRHHFVAAAGRY